MAIWQRWWLKKQGLYDSRLFPAREDLADADVKNLVVASRYVQAKSYKTIVPDMCVRARPDEISGRETTFLYGEPLRVLEIRSDGWVWGQSAVDGYVGYVRHSDIEATELAPNRRVCVQQAQIYSKPDLKSLTIGTIPFHSFLAVDLEKSQNGYVPLIGQEGWMCEKHLWSLEKPFQEHPVTLARRFIGAPYLWGGKASHGLDCSALVQLVCFALNVACPRDSDQQRMHLGVDVTDNILSGAEKLRAGDLVYFPGHVGIMGSETALIHANAAHMGVVEEPLSDVLARGEKGKDLPIIAVKRVDFGVSSVKPIYAQTMRFQP